MAAREYTDEFNRFWEAWPSPKDQKFSEYKRKTDKPKCFDVWKKRGYEKIAATIIRDVEQKSKYDKSWLDGKGKYLSAPLVYLNNERWDGSEYADIRDERKAASTPSQSVHAHDSGPPMSRWARYANKYLLAKIQRVGGTGSQPGRASETLARAIAAKNEIVNQAESDGDWEDSDFVSVIQKSINDAFMSVPHETAA